MSLRGKLGSIAHGEVSTAPLAAYSSASGEAYDLLEAMQPTGPGRLSAWCAFVLQTHADNLLGSGSARGCATREACEEAEILYQLAGAWLARAHEAAANDAYRLDVSVPQRLPRPRAPRTDGVLRAMRRTLETVQARVGADLAARSAEPVAVRLRAMMPAVQTAIDTSAALAAPSLGDGLRETLGQTLQGGLDRAYQIGQLLALPELLAAPEPAAPARIAHDSSNVELFLPGDPGFDPWCLTDPMERRRREESATALAQLEALWKADPGPAKTLRVQAQIDWLLERGAVDYLPELDGGTLHRIASQCPWPGVLYAKAGIALAEKSLEHGDRFVFAVGATDEGFRRAIVSVSAAAVAALEAAPPLPAGGLGDLLSGGLLGPGLDVFGI